MLSGETKIEDVAKLTEHEWDEGEVTTEPTHTEVGERTFSCACGETKTEVEPKTTEHRLTSHTTPIISKAASSHTNRPDTSLKPTQSASQMNQ